MKNKQLPQLLIAILFSLAIGLLSALLSGNIKTTYDMMSGSPFKVPAIVFPIVWTILYILMGISSYIIFRSDSEYKRIALGVYLLQLLLNFSYSIVTFRFGLKGLGLFITIALLFLVLFMTLLFNKIDKKAALLQIPYLIWLCIAILLGLFYL